jgi:hypothetical protein
MLGTKSKSSAPIDVQSEVSHASVKRGAAKGSASAAPTRKNATLRGRRQSDATRCDSRDPRKSAKTLAGGARVGARRFINVVEQTEVDFLSMNLNLRSPFLARLMPANPLHSAGIIHLHRGIGFILRSRRLAKIAKPIIGFDTVDVIQVQLWKPSHRESPAHPMGLHRRVGDLHNKITMTRDVSGALTMASAAMVLQLASFLIV